MLNLSHKNLDVYKISLTLLTEIYRITNQYPPEEKFGLVSQLRRAGISVSSNIAEGASRITKKEKKRFYEIARSSDVEIDTQMEISLLLNYIKKEEITNLETSMESVFKMLSKMIENINLNTHSPLPTSH